MAVNVRYIVPVVHGTDYLLYHKDLAIQTFRPVTSDLIDFNDGENIFATSIEAIRVQVLQERFDVYCKQRIYRRDDETFDLETSILKALGFVTLDQED